MKIEARYDGKGIQTGVSSRAVFDAWLSEGESAVTTDSEGRWKLDNVPPGDDVDVRIKLSHRDYIDDRDWGQLQKEQHVTTKALRAQTAVIVMHRGTGVTGTVTDADGKTGQGRRRDLGRSALLGRGEPGGSHQRTRCVSLSAACRRGPCI